MIAEQEEAVPFMVLQCKNCRTILGDTGSLLSLQKESLIITLTKKSANVNVDEDLETSKEGTDYGSTFNNLFCKNCNEWLGRCYRTTSPELDNLRGNFTFGMGQLIMFEMESSHLNNSQTGEISPPAQKNSIDSVEIVKLQKFVVALYDRIEQLELENDTIRNELHSMNARISSHQGDGMMPELLPSKSKTKRVRVKNTTVKEPNAKDSSLKFLKSAATSLMPPSSESVDTNSALEIVSWSILSGRNASNSMKLISESLAM